jgi:hypothetical protein
MSHHVLKCLLAALVIGIGVAAVVAGDADDPLLPTGPAGAPKP